MENRKISTSTRTRKKDAMQEARVIRLSIEDQRRVAAAILNPPAPAKALKKAAKRHRELFGPG